MADEKTYVTVACRLRPLSEKEKRDIMGVSSSWYRVGRTIHPPRNSTAPTFEPQYAFGQETRTEEIYKQIVSSMVEKCFDGYSGTVLCYGDSGSGKTYTLCGSGVDEDGGLISLAANDILKRLSDESRTFHLRVGAFDVLNNEVKNLIGGESSTAHQGFVLIPAFSADDFSHAIRDVMKARRIRDIKLDTEKKNATTVMSIMIESVPNRRENNEEIPVTSGVLRFIDLAASGEAQVTKSVAQAFKELKVPKIGPASRIRKTISYSAATTQVFRGKKPVPEQANPSRLDCVLKLNVNESSLITVICTISPTAVLEPLATLTFSKSLANILLKPVRNCFKSSEQEYSKIAEEWEKQLATRFGEAQRYQKQLNTIYKFYKRKPLPSPLDGRGLKLNEIKSESDSGDPLRSLGSSEKRVNPIQKRVQEALNQAVGACRTGSVSADEGAGIGAPSLADEFARKEKKMQEEITNLRDRLNKAEESKTVAEKEVDRLQMEVEKLNGLVKDTQDQIEQERKKREELVELHEKLEAVRSAQYTKLRECLAFTQQAQVLRSSLESLLGPIAIPVNSAGSSQEKREGSASSRGSTAGPGEQPPPDSDDLRITAESPSGILCTRARANHQLQLPVFKTEGGQMNQSQDLFNASGQPRRKRKRTKLPKADCPVCGVQLSCKYSVRGHLQSIHKWKKPVAMDWMETFHPTES